MAPETDLAPLVYVLGAVTTSMCSVLLFIAFRRTRTPLLLWSALCFGGFAISHVLAFVDLVLVPTVDLYTLRLLTGIAAMALLLYGLIWQRG
jgi:hypothetical protein